MGAVFGFFIGSLSQMSNPMMVNNAVQPNAPKASVMTEVAIGFGALHVV